MVGISDLGVGIWGLEFDDIVFVAGSNRRGCLWGDGAAFWLIVGRSPTDFRSSGGWAPIKPDHS